MERVIEIFKDGARAGLNRGFMEIRLQNEDLGRVAIHDIGVLLISSHGATLSTPLINAILNAKGMIVFTGEKYMPTGFIWPMGKHSREKELLHLQIDSSKPFQKRFWQETIQAKLRFQAQVLKDAIGDDEGLLELSKKVDSGDSKNLESQGAQRYWKAMYGLDFRRRQGTHQEDIYLNYGYTIIRSFVARTIACAGLNPSLGINHHNLENSFCLVDDLMEPFRPLVDWQVWNLDDEEGQDISFEIKRTLAKVLYIDLECDGKVSPVKIVIEKFVQSFVRSLRSGKIELVLPKNILPIQE